MERDPLLFTCSSLESSSFLKPSYVTLSGLTQGNLLQLILCLYCPITLVLVPYVTPVQRVNGSPLLYQGRLDFNLSATVPLYSSYLFSDFWHSVVTPTSTHVLLSLIDKTK